MDVTIAANVNQLFGGGHRNVADANRPDRPDFRPDARQRVHPGFDVADVLERAETRFRVLNIPPHVNLDLYADAVPGWSGEWAVLDLEGEHWPDEPDAQLDAVAGGIARIRAKWPRTRCGIYGFRWLRQCPEAIRHMQALFPTHYIRDLQHPLPQDKLQWWALQAKHGEALAQLHDVDVVPLLDARVLQGGREVYGAPELWQIVPLLYRGVRTCAVWDNPVEPGEAEQLAAHIVRLRDVFRKAA